MRQLRGVPDEVITVPVEPGTADERSLSQIVEQFNLTSAIIHEDWKRERDSKPVEIAEGKAILNRLGAELRQLQRVPHERIDEAIIAMIESTVNNIEEIQGHRLYLDGGLSYGNFWRVGDTIVEASTEIGQLLRASLAI